MSRKPQDPRDEALRELLRQGDPVGDGCEPTPEEIARMRRQVLDAAGAHSSGPWLPGWRPVAAVTAVIVVALATWLVLRDADRTAPALRRAQESAAGAEPHPQYAEAISEEPAGPPEPQPAADSLTDQAPEREQVRIASASTDPNGTDVPVAAAEDRSARTIRFTTRNGTRIIWTLDPNFEI
jgi:hypothetical protein